MKAIHLVILCVTFGISSHIYGGELQCVDTNKSKETFCGTLPNALGLDIRNNCSHPIRSTFCYENSTSEWECMSDTVFAGEEFFGFMSCNATGDYLVKHCSNDNASCAFEAPIPESTLTCSDGRKVDYSIVDSGKSVLHLKTAKGLQQLLLTHTKAKTQFSNSQAIASFLCESVSEGIIESIERKLFESIDRYSNKLYKSCIAEHKNKQSVGEICERLVDKIPTIGVRG